MALYFRTAPADEPFIFDSIGNHWAEGRTIRPNGYPLYHYLQTETGCGRIEIQGKTYLLNEGEGVLLAPFISHSYAPESRNWISLFVTITGSMESGIAGILGNRQLIFIEREHGKQIEQFISDILKKCEKTPVNTKELSIDCYSFLMNFVDGMQGDKIIQEPLYQRYVAPVIKEIELNYNTKLTVDALSQKVYITPQYLSRLFNRYLGCSVYKYLTAYRITKAKEILCSSSRVEIQNLSYQVGFDDASHFITMFKKMTGVTPLEFHKLYKFHS